MGTTWFTSDPHLGHTNIIKYTGRPFLTDKGEPDVEMMDEQLITNWNSYITDRDTVYILGDFCFWHPKKVSPASYFHRLRGHKILIKGNHDKKETLKLPWDRVYPDGQAIVKLDGQRMTLNHCSMQVWEGSHKGAWHLFGHSHGEIAAIGRSGDVSVDGVADYYAARRNLLEKDPLARRKAVAKLGENAARAWHRVAGDLRLAQDYRPQNFDEIRERLEALEFVGVDGHGQREVPTGITHPHGKVIK